MAARAELWECTVIRSRVTRSGLRWTCFAVLPFFVFRITRIVCLKVLILPWVIKVD